MIGMNIHDTESHRKYSKGVDAMIRWQLGGRLHHPMTGWYSSRNIVSFLRGWTIIITSQKLGPLIANCHSVILMGAGVSAEDLGFESPLCRIPTHKVAGRQNVGAEPGPCGGGL